MIFSYLSIFRNHLYVIVVGNLSVSQVGIMTQFDNANPVIYQTKERAKTDLSIFDDTQVDEIDAGEVVITLSLLSCALASL